MCVCLCVCRGGVVLSMLAVLILASLRRSCLTGLCMRAMALFKSAVMFVHVCFVCHMHKCTTCCCSFRSNRVTGGENWEYSVLRSQFGPFHDSLYKMRTRVEKWFGSIFAQRIENRNMALMLDHDFRCPKSCISILKRVLGLALCCDKRGKRLLQAVLNKPQ